MWQLSRTRHCRYIQYGVSLLGSEPSNLLTILRPNLTFFVKYRWVTPNVHIFDSALQIFGEKRILGDSSFSDDHTNKYFVFTSIESPG